MQKLLKLDFNERSDNLSPLLRKLPYGENLWRYPQRQPLEQKLAQIYQLSPNQVLCTNGGDEAIMLLMRLIKETARLILPRPAFSQYTWGVQSWGLEAQLIPCNEDLSIDLGATLQAIESNNHASGKSTVTIITRPNNPTGELIALKDLFRLIEAAKANNGWVFVDEAYIEFSHEKSIAECLISKFDNVVILRTLSKAYGLAGIRLGYLLGASNIIQALTERCMPFNIPLPSLQIAEQALEPENTADMLQYCQRIRENRQQVIAYLQTIGARVLPSEANFVTIQLAPGQAIAIKSFLAKNAVLVRSFDNDEMQCCLRITIPSETTGLLKLLKQCLQPDLICLDMDGVLIDTSGSYDASVIATVKRMSGREICQQDIINLKNTGGFNNDWVVSQALLKTIGFEFNLQQVIDVFQKIYLGENDDGLVINETRLINAELANKINRLQAVDGATKFAIVTGRPAKEAKAGQQLTQLTALDVISLDDVVQPKPSPEGICILQKKYSSFSWMCGDNPDDMQAANASNSLAIGIGLSNAETLYQAGADIVFDNINQLEAWL